MLGWTLLQIHNHATVDAFLAEVRTSIALGTFEADRAVFETAYAPELPQGEGVRPRTRGYEFKSEHGQKKKNAKVYGRFEGDERNGDMLAEEGVALDEIEGAEELVEHGMGLKNEGL